MHKTLPIWRDANQLLLDIEQAVKHFPRYHKYTLGSELRRQAMRICRLVGRAWRDKANAQHWLEKLIPALDDLKIQLQLAKELKVFRHFAEFERLATLTVAVGKQSGGWLRRLQGSSQPEVVRKA
jgi:four helix bundle protein